MKKLHQIERKLLEKIKDLISESNKVNNRKDALPVYDLCEELLKNGKFECAKSVDNEKIELILKEDKSMTREFLLEILSRPELKKVYEECYGPL